MKDSLKKLLPIFIIVILSFALCILLFIIFKKKNCGNTKELYNSPNSSGDPSGAFTRGICLDTTTVDATSKAKPPKLIPPVWNKIKTWPLTSSPITSVRTYSFGGELPWIQYLLSQNVEVFIGISKYESIPVMCKTLKSWDSSMLTKIIAFSVFNEPTSNRDAKKGDTVTYHYNSMKTIANQLRSCLKTVYTNGLHPPITACFVANSFSTIPEYKSLFKSQNGNPPVLDPLVCSNIYSDLFSDNTNKPMTETALENSVSWSKDNIIVKDQINPYYTLVKNINPNAKLWITEIGWTSAPLASFAKGKGWASVDVEKKMYENFLNASTDQGILWPERVFWFTIRDTRNADKNESFGLFNEKFESKFGDSPPPPPIGSSCDASGIIEDGNSGNCTNTLNDGATCYPGCHTGYTLIGNRTCNNGKLTDTAKCNLNTQGGYGTNENPFKDGCAKGAYCNNGGTLCFNNNDFYCQPNCSNTTKPNCDKYPPPAKCQPFCPPPRPPSGDGYKDGEDIFQQKCSKGKKCANPTSKICFNSKLQKFSCEPSCSNSITPDCVHNPPKDQVCRSVFCPNT